MIRSCTVLLLVLLLACGGDRLPKPTTEGKNTFGCKINGRTFLAEDAKGLFSRGKGVYARYDRSGRYLYIRGSRADETSGSSFKTQKDISFYITGVGGVGTYELNRFIQNNGAESTGSYEEYWISPATYYHTNAPRSGHVKITKLDMNRGIIAGTFEFRAVNTSDSTDVVHITAGRFDISTRN